MKNKMTLLFAGLAMLIVVTGVLVYKAAFSPKLPPPAEEEEVLEALLSADASISVDVTKSKVKDNTVVLTVNGLGSTYTMLSYELSYETLGIVQGVTSAPIDITGKSTFVRDDIYLGTCSRNVCKPHVGVKTISAVIVFTDASGSRSQFSKEYEL